MARPLLKDRSPEQRITLAATVVTKLVKIVQEAVGLAGHDGVPESIVYMALHEQGANHDDALGFINAMVDLGLLCRINHRLVLP